MVKFFILHPVLRKKHNLILSVIIVNYNVKYFLEQCLCSVKKAIADIDAEVIIVDNHSADGSVEYLQPAFPFTFIRNEENIGFARANNQGLRMAKGKYLLFLNPDTLVPEDCFKSCISFMESNKDAGALGTKMIDGSGRFLKESKRAFPTPWISFCKMCGLTSIFPSSALFAGYYLGHLPMHETNEAGALAGAFMFVKKAVLEITGGFDEQFFMYAEDIDLSYRIQQAGFKNFYFSKSTIIHFKGESTTRDIFYIKLFYKAMRQFVKKHYQQRSGTLTHFLSSGIWFAGLLSSASHFKKQSENRIANPPSVKSITIGDAQSQEEAARIIARYSNRKIVSDKIDADEWLLCQGDKFSYKELIGIIGKQPRKKVMVHSAGSRSIVGSDDKNHRGHVLT